MPIRRLALASLLALTGAHARAAPAVPRSPPWLPTNSGQAVRRASARAPTRTAAQRRMGSSFATSALRFEFDMAAAP